jgi:hypothetical protein
MRRLYVRQIVVSTCHKVTNFLKLIEFTCMVLLGTETNAFEIYY